MKLEIIVGKKILTVMAVLAMIGMGASEITFNDSSPISFLSDLDMNSNRITNLQDPVDPDDVATKSYADSIEADVKNYADSNDDVSDSDSSPNNEGADSKCGASEYLRGDGSCVEETALSGDNTPRVASESVVRASGGTGTVKTVDINGGRVVGGTLKEDIMGDDELSCEHHLEFYVSYSDGSSTTLRADSFKKYYEYDFTSASDIDEISFKYDSDFSDYRCDGGRADSRLIWELHYYN